MSAQADVERLLLAWGRHFRWGDTLDQVMRYLRESDGPEGSFVALAKMYATWLESARRLGLAAESAREREEGSE